MKTSVLHDLLVIPL